MGPKNDLNFTPKVLKQIPNQTKYKTFGYIRRQKRKLNLPTIPQLIMHKCLLFVKEQECFYIHDADGPLELTDNQQTLTLPDVDHYFGSRIYRALGTVFINNTLGIIATWKLKINKCYPYGEQMRLGLVDTEKRYFSNRYFFYVSNDGKVHSNSDVRECITNKFVQAFLEKDEISLILDLYDQQIRYKLNDQPEKCLLCLKTKPLKPTNYKFFADLHVYKTSISIIDFSMSSKK